MCVVIFDEDANLNHIEEGVVRIYSTDLSQVVSQSKLVHVLADAEHGKYLAFIATIKFLAFIAQQKRSIISEPNILEKRLLSNRKR